MPAALPRTQMARRDLAAHHLRTLLTENDRYRQMWVPRAGKLPPSEISQAAVAKVISDYLQTGHALPAEDQTAYRPLKDRVYRALSGQSLTPATLNLFVRAFLFTQEDARELLSMLLGTSPEAAGTTIKDWALPSRMAAALQPANYRIVELEETLIIGDDGLPKEHRSSQRIAAEKDGLSRLPVRFDTDSPTIDIDAADVQLSDVYRCPDGMYAVDLLLPQVLKSGQEAKFRCVLLYQSGTRNDAEFRRSALRRVIDNAVIRVEFKGKPPPHVWWAVWQDLDESAGPVLRMPIILDEGQQIVERTVKSAGKTIFGFCWEW